MAEKRAQKTKKDGDGNYEEDLDTYFVDRLRFLNQRDHTTQHLKQRFKVLPRPPPRTHSVSPVVCAAAGEEWAPRGPGGDRRR
jgi:hypothetical protein